MGKLISGMGWVALRVVAKDGTTKTRKRRGTTEHWKELVEKEMDSPGPSVEMVDW